MQRTWQSIIGGVVLILFSFATGFGGLAWITFSTEKGARQFFSDFRQSLAEAEKNPTATQQQREQIAAMRQKMNDFEKNYDDENFRTRAARWMPLGFFELMAAVAGVIGGITMIIGGRAGRICGALGAVVGAATCVWATLVGVPIPVAAEVMTLLVYVMVLISALSINISEPHPIS